MSPRKAKRIRDEKMKRQENPVSKSREKLDEQKSMNHISINSPCVLFRQRMVIIQNKLMKL